MPRISVVLSEETERRLRRAVPRGRRSQVVERALAAYLAEQERGEAFARLRSLSARTPEVPLARIVADLRKDREGR